MTARDRCLALFRGTAQKARGHRAVDPQKAQTCDIHPSNAAGGRAPDIRSCFAAGATQTTDWAISLAVAIVPIPQRRRRRLAPDQPKKKSPAPPPGQNSHRSWRRLVRAGVREKWGTQLPHCQCCRFSDLLSIPRGSRRAGARAGLKSERESRAQTLTAVLQAPLSAKPPPSSAAPATTRSH